MSTTASHSLNSRLRKEELAKCPDLDFDLLIIGGGITGAGIALDAASRGMKVMLCEKQDYAQGTSSRSTKLIHGGLRYLKQFEFGIVRETGRERAVLHRLAPHIVIPAPMLLPLKKGGSLSPMLTSLALWMYDRLAGVKPGERRRMLSREETLRHEPLLRPEGLLGAGAYFEYRTDDNRLVIEVLKAAAAYGAQCFNYLCFLSATTDQGKATGGRLRDVLSGEEYVIRAKKVVNATGPWVDEVRKTEGPLKGKHLRHTRGIHIVFPWQKLPLRSPVYFDVPGGRMVFAIPRDGITYVGTTDTDYKGSLEHPEAEPQDIDYLLSCVNAVFSRELKTADVISTWAGIRPLIEVEGKNASELSRKDEIWESPSGMISIAGGKLTGYRKMAERVVDKIVKDIGVAFPASPTEHIPLNRTPEAFQHFHDMSPKQLQEGMRYCQEHEGALLADDFLVRRSGLSFFRPEKEREIREQAMAFFGDGISPENE